MWSNARRAAIDAAAYQTGIQLAELDARGSGFKFKLRPIFDDRLDEEARACLGQRPTDRKYQRISGDSSEMQWKTWEQRNRRVAAICWHGHRDFLRALYAMAPDCTVRTVLTTYKSADDFEARYRETRDGMPGKNGVMLTSSLECVCGDDE